MKKVLILLLSLLLLAGCGKTAPVQEAPATAAPAVSETKATEAPTAEPTPAPTAEPTPSPAEEAAKLVGDAQALLEAGETEENLAAALQLYLDALALNGADTDAFLGAADVYIRQGRFDDALAFLQERAGDAPAEAVAAKIAELEAGNVNDSQGKVRKLTGTAADGPSYVHLYDYDEQGRLCRVTWLDGDGVERDHVDVTYDEQGKTLTRADHVTSSSLAGSLIHTTFTYDDQGREISARSILPGEWDEETRYFYDEQGHMVRWETYNNDELVLIDIFEDFDDHGKAQKRSTYVVSGNTERLQEYWLIEYDYETYTRKDSKYSPDGVLRGWSVWTFSSDWTTILDEVAYDADGNIKHESHAEKNE